MVQVRESMSRAQRELANPNFRDIDARYRKQLIELETTRMATTDLEKFHRACRHLPPARPAEAPLDLH